MKLWLKLWRRKTGQSLSFEELDEWDFWKKLGISEEEFMDVMNEAWRLWRIMPPTEPNLSEKVARIKSLGRLDIVTGRPRKTEQYALKWLKLQKIPYDEYIWVRSSSFKSALNYDVYIDDYPMLADDCMKAGKLLILYDRPWNRGVQDSPHVKRVKNLDEAYKVIKEVLR